MRRPNLQYGSTSGTGISPDLTSHLASIQSLVIARHGTIHSQRVSYYLPVRLVSSSGKAGQRGTRQQTLKKRKSRRSRKERQTTICSIKVRCRVCVVGCDGVCVWREVFNLANLAWGLYDTDKVLQELLDSEAQSQCLDKLKLAECFRKVGGESVMVIAVFFQCRQQRILKPSQITINHTSHIDPDAERGRYDRDEQLCSRGAASQGKGANQGHGTSAFSFTFIICVWRVNPFHMFFFASSLTRNPFAPFFPPFFCLNPISWSVSCVRFIVCYRTCCGGAFSPSALTFVCCGRRNESQALRGPAPPTACSSPSSNPSLRWKPRSWPTSEEWRQWGGTRASGRGTGLQSATGTQSHELASRTYPTPSTCGWARLAALASTRRQTLARARVRTAVRAGGPTVCLASLSSCWPCVRSSTGP